MKCITENPFRILGLYTNAKEREVTKRINYLNISLGIGKSLSLESDFPVFPSMNRTPESVSDAANKIEQLENRIYHTFFWFSKVDSVDGVALDVLKEGNSEKAIELWEKTFQRKCNTEDRPKEEIDAVLDQILIPYLRSHYEIEATLADERKVEAFRKSLTHHIKAIIAYFSNSDDDPFSISHEAVAIDDSGKEIKLDMGSIKNDYEPRFKDIVNYSLALSRKQFSHAKNLAVLYLGLSLQNTSLNTHYLNRGLSLSGRMFHSPDSLSHYVTSIAGSAHQSNLDKIPTLFAEEILKSLENVLGEAINKELKDLISSFRFFPQEARSYAIETLTRKPLRGIKKKVASTKQKRIDSPLTANTYGEDLYISTCNDLSLLYDILTPENLQYQEVADAVADEIVSCSIDFFNGHLRGDDSVDPGRDALKLARHAESIALDVQIKDRISNGIPIIEKWINDEPARHRRKEADPYIKLIIQQIETSPEVTHNSPAEFGIATRLLEKCKPALLALRGLHRCIDLPSVLILERFTNNDSSWKENGTNSFIKRILDGQYCLENHHEEKSCWSWGLSNIEFADMQMFTIECSISKTGGPDDAAFGLVCAHDEIDNHQTYLSFKITAEGYFIFSIINAEDTEHYGWERSVYISEGNGPNTLRIQQIYDTLQYYINDHALGQISRKTHGSGIGFIVDPGVSIAVNYLYFCNASIGGFQDFLDYDFYIHLSSMVVRRVLDSCISYANGTNDMQKTLNLMNEIKELDMVSDLKERFAENESIINRNLRLARDESSLGGSPWARSTKSSDRSAGPYRDTRTGTGGSTTEKRSFGKIGWILALITIPLILISLIVSNQDQPSQPNVNPPVRKPQAFTPEPSQKTIPLPASPSSDIIKSEPREKPLPENAAVRIFTGAERVAPLKIIASQEYHYLVKLVDVNTNRDVMTIFVRKGQTANTKVPLGAYQVKYVSGDVWYGYGKKQLFGPNGAYGKAEKEFVFQIVGNQVSGYSITLYQVAHGNLHTRPLSVNEF